MPRKAPRIAYNAFLEAVRYISLPRQIEALKNDFKALNFGSGLFLFSRRKNIMKKLVKLAIDNLWTGIADYRRYTRETVVLDDISEILQTAILYTDHVNVGAGKRTRPLLGNVCAEQIIEKILQVILILEASVVVRLVSNFIIHIFFVLSLSKNHISNCHNKESLEDEQNYAGVYT